MAPAQKAQEAREDPLKMLDKYKDSQLVVVVVYSKEMKVERAFLSLQKGDQVYDFSQGKWISLKPLRDAGKIIYKGYIYDPKTAGELARASSQVLSGLVDEDKRRIAEKLDPVAHWIPPLDKLLYGRVNTAETASRAGTMNVETKANSLMVRAGVLSRGMEGKEVEQLQSDLEKMGYCSGNPANRDGRGVYGPETEKGVRRLQNEWSLDENGVFGKKEREALDAKMRGEEPKPYAPKAGEPYARGEAVKVEFDLEDAARKFHAKYQDRIDNGWRGKEESGFRFGVDKQGGFVKGCTLYASMLLQELYPDIKIPAVINVRSLLEGQVLPNGTVTSGPTNGGLVFSGDKGPHGLSNHAAVTILGSDGKWYVFQDYKGLSIMPLDTWVNEVGFAGSTFSQHERTIRRQYGDNVADTIMHNEYQGRVCFGRYPGT